MQIQANMKMADVIHFDYHLLMIISRFGINLGFGDKSVVQVCRDYGINVDFFLEIVNSYHNKNYFPQKHLQAFSLKLIVDYLRKSHEYYLRSKIPDVENLLNRLSEHGGNPNDQSFQLIHRFFREYRDELHAHIQREEDKVYPYVFSVEKAYLGKKSDPAVVGLIRQYSIDDYESEHDNVEDKLLDLKNIIIKYLAVPVDPKLSQAVLYELFRLESDLRDHARIEDKILVPKVKFMEKWILEHYTE